MFLSVKEISVFYGALEALKNISMEIQAGLLYAILGANGAGKSTLFKAVSGLQRLASGSIWFEGERIDGISTYQILRKGIAQVPEGKRIFRNLTVLENLNMGAYSRTDGKKAIARTREELFERFPLLSEKAKEKAESLSGGQQQLLVISRALMAKPKLFLLDEPAQGLAPLVIKEIANTIKRLNKTGLTTILIEHNVRFSLGLADSVFILDNGNLIFQGTPSDFSEDEYTQKVYLGA